MPFVEHDAASLLTLTERPRFRITSESSASVLLNSFPEHACLQIGVGGGTQRSLRGAGRDRGDLKHPAHTEVLNPALARLIQNGVVTQSMEESESGKDLYSPSQWETRLSMISCMKTSRSKATR